MSAPLASPPHGPARGFLARGGGWALGQSVLMLLVLGLGPVFPEHTLGWSGGARTGAAWALSLIGAVFGIAGAWVLGGNRTIFPRPNPDSRLVTRGVYGLVRHPLYTSVLSLSLGWALWWGSGAAVAAAVALGVFLDRKARREERWLREQFEGYDAYARRVRRFVPGLY